VEAQAFHDLTVGAGHTQYCLCMPQGFRVEREPGIATEQLHDVGGCIGPDPREFEERVVDLVVGSLAVFVPRGINAAVVWWLCEESRDPDNAIVAIPDAAQRAEP